MSSVHTPVRWWHSSPAQQRLRSAAPRGRSARRRAARARARGRGRRASTRSRATTSVVVGAVAQHLARPLVQRAPRGPARRLVARDEHRHRAGDDARHRPDAADVVVGHDRRRRRRRRAPAPPRGSRRGPRSSSRRRAPPASAGTCARGAIGGPACETPPAAWWGLTSRAGTTSTSSGVAWARAATAGSVYSVVFTVRDATGGRRIARHGHQGRRTPISLGHLAQMSESAWPG